MRQNNKFVAPNLLSQNLQSALFKQFVQTKEGDSD
jgi:hypothetical protein